MTDKPKLLIISTVLPFPRNAGQQQRVYYKLRALRDKFHLTFLTIASRENIEPVREKLLELADNAIIIPSAYTRSGIHRIIHMILGGFFVVKTGLKFSNYLTGEVEFSVRRMEKAIGDRAFDAVLFEYWHAHKAAGWFRQRGTPSILDMHDILWRSYARQLDAKKLLPAFLKRWMVRRYQVREESAWNDFDVLIAINQDELQYARQHVRPDRTLLYAPMGTDISTWPYSWQPAVNPRRVAYYGSLGSVHNQQDALLCYREIMPVIWAKIPDAELWIVGSNPPPVIRDLARDPRVCVTGFVESPQEILATMSLVLCPWSGKYGFRSRVVEVMALGVPVVASEDAVYGMGFRKGQGIVLEDAPAKMALLSVDWISDNSILKYQSTLARQQVEEMFSYEATYLPLVENLFRLCSSSMRKNQVNNQ